MSNVLEINLSNEERLTLENMDLKAKIASAQFQAAQQAFVVAAQDILRKHDMLKHGACNVEFSKDFSKLTITPNGNGSIADGVNGGGADVLDAETGLPMRQRTGT